jgi:MoaA/NifB/PqqE/SkfB family radical SAM enzyme
MGRIEPSQIRLEACSHCQLRCPSCPTATGAIDAVVGKGFLKFADFRNLIDRNPSLRRVELSNYGEIFLNPDLLRILEYADARRVIIDVQNGANLNHVRDAVLEGLVKYHVAAITCSIDGASAETYRKYRVGGDFDTVIANIKRINHYRRAYRSKLPNLAWQFVVFGHNEHEIPHARAMARALGMRFFTKLSWDSGFSPIRDKEFVRKQTGMPVVTREEYEQISGKKYLNRICYQLWNKPQINWDGKVLGCCRNFWGDFGGNAFTDGLVESLNNEKIAYARDMLLGNKPARDDVPCTTCEMYPAMRRNSQWIRQPDVEASAEMAQKPVPATRDGTRAAVNGVGKS